MWIFTIGTQLAAIRAMLASVLEVLECVIVAKIDDVRAVLATLDSETTAMAERVEAIIEQLQGGVTASEADEIIAALSEDAARLRTFGTDPADPFPGVPVEPPEV